MQKLTKAIESSTKLITRALNQIHDRRLSVPYGFLTHLNDMVIKDRTHKPSMWILYARYYARYSAQQQWWITASYLCGHSNKQDWAVRIPSTIKKIDEALNWLTPTEVKKAIKKGKVVYRQGDMYFIPINGPTHDFSALFGTKHVAMAVAGATWPDRLHSGPVRIAHPQHDDIVLDAEHYGKISWKAVQQKQLHTGNTRVGAD